MSTAIPPRDGGAPLSSGVVALADETALHAAFLSEYRALAEEARTDLGAAGGLSQKVVEGAFVRAWDARMKLRTTEELHRFLVDDVHHASARALARRGGDTGDAAAPPAPEIDPDEAWAHIQHALHGEQHSAGALAEAAAISRHDAAHHISAATKEQGWRALVAAGVAAAALVAVLLVWLDRRGDDKRLARAIDASDTRVITAPAGRVGELTLEDGSRVRLAPDSRLSIPATFGDRVRGVRLEGAAAFDVAPGQARAFRVSARAAVVVATGTSFTVRAYPGDAGVSVVVTSGSVEVHHAGQEPTLASGGALVLPNGAAPRAATPAEREAAAGWTGGMLSIDARPLREVLPQLRRWYGMDVTVPDASLLDRPVTVRASLDSARQVIRGIERSTGLEFGYAGRTMVFRAPGAVPAETR